MIKCSENQTAGMLDINMARDGDESVGEVLFDEPGSSGPKIRYGFHAAGLRFLVPEGMVSELLDRARIYHLPNAPHWVCGLINMHGKVIPVVDLAGFIGNELSHLNKSKILAVKKQDMAVGILIDGFPEAVIETDMIVANDIEGIPTELDRYMHEGISSNGVIWRDLDIYGLLKQLVVLQTNKIGV